jgi:hypothetical protein
MSKSWAEVKTSTRLDQVGSTPVNPNPTADAVSQAF